MTEKTFVDTIIYHRWRIIGFLFGMLLLICTAAVNHTSIDADPFGYCTLILIEALIVLWSLGVTEND